MPEILISSEIDLIIGSSGEVETVDVVGMVESVKIGEEIGIETRGRDVSTELICDKESLFENSPNKDLSFCFFFPLPKNEAVLN
ncbi:unnamed protein product [Lactuca saligna]|uniref:Uncharacterized protein n=1 Tax=Lactuca saligna TaxID=75948 RepID=A0AA36EBB3_LACSI|nr:unnamed protein product [Lactuca saligna]